MMRGPRTHTMEGDEIEMRSTEPGLLGCTTLDPRPGLQPGTEHDRREGTRQAP